jgi:hypothetical protein
MRDWTKLLYLSGGTIVSSLYCQGQTQPIVAPRRALLRAVRRSVETPATCGCVNNHAMLNAGRTGFESRTSNPIMETLIWHAPNRLCFAIWMN